MSYNYCFVCVSHYQHMLSVIYAEELHTRRGSQSLIIDKYCYGQDNKHVNFGSILLFKKNFFTKMFLAVSMIMPRLLVMSKIKKAIVNVDAVVYFNDRDPLTQFVCKCISSMGSKKILMEEGLSTYFFTDNKQKLIGTICKPDIAIVGYPALYSKYHKDLAIILKLEYKAVFSVVNVAKFCINAEMQSSYELLFLGQATPDSEALRAKELNVLNWIIQKYPNIRILVKPHPRDIHPSRYSSILLQRNVTVLDKKMQSYPIEILVYNIALKIVMSLYSSGCVTLANMFPQLNVIYVFEMVALCSPNFNKIKELCEYIANLNIPNDFQELSEVLAKSSDNVTVKQSENINIDISMF